MSRSVSSRSSPSRPPIRATLSSTSSRSICSVRSSGIALGAELRPSARRADAVSVRRRSGTIALARWRASVARCSRRRDGGACSSRGAARASRSQALALLLRRPRARAAGGRGTPRRSISRARNTSGATRVELRRRRRGAARRSAGSARAPPAAPAATRSRRVRPTTRSSLRRRATWITRARSTWRSSIGGRASARTTAAASCGSTSRRIQASTSRTSARLRKLAARRFVRPALAADGDGGDLSSPDTAQGYAVPRARAGLRSWVDAIDWGDRAADRRAGRRLAAARTACARRRSSRSRTTSPRA